jgi:hypothetical protein
MPDINNLFLLKKKAIDFFNGFFLGASTLKQGCPTGQSRIDFKSIATSTPSSV